jgi:hypothetical protein
MDAERAASATATEQPDGRDSVLVATHELRRARRWCALLLLAAACSCARKRVLGRTALACRSAAMARRAVQLAGAQRSRGARQAAARLAVGTAPGS